MINFEKLGLIKFYKQLNQWDALNQGKKRLT